MNTNDEKVVFKELSYNIVGLAMEVHKKLVYGFMEKIYENAMMVLPEREKISARQQVAIPVYFEEKIIGDYFADIVVDNKIILEIKAATSIMNTHCAQLLNYLTATKLQLGIILNFGKKKLEYDRLVN